MKKSIINFIAIILSIITIIFIWHKFLISGNTIILLIMLIPFYCFFQRVLEKENKKKFIISLIIAICFAIIQLICTSINIDYILNNIFNKWIVLNFLGYVILAWSTTSSVYTFFEDYKFESNGIKIGKFEVLSDSKLSFYINVMLILLAWLPYFLRYFPGLLTADSCAQVAQSIGMAELTNHHPIFHTGIIAVFINLGKLIFNNINIGVAFYTIFQMIAMASMFSMVLKYISKKNVPFLARVVTLLYYMFYPINALFSVTMWKDILFAGIIPIYTILTIELIFNTQGFFEKNKNTIWYIIVSVLVIFLRNNGLYIVVFVLPFVIIVLRRYWKRVIVISCVIIVSYISLKTLIFNIFNIKEGSVGEMLSVPLQQIVRVKKYHKQEMDIDTLQQIDLFFRCDNIEEKYNPILSDPVKAELNTEYFENNKNEFIKLWIKLLKTYFKDYVESFISNSYGYYYPEAKHWVANRTMEVNNMGIHQTQLIEGKLVSKIDSLIERRDIPIISMFFSIGVAFWIIVMSLGYEILNKEYKSIISYLIIFVLWLTIIASPVFCEYRYAYPMFTILPLYISLNFVRKGVKK